MNTFLPGRYELLRMRDADSSGDVFLRTVSIVLDIFADSAHEECWLLTYESDLLPECVNVEGFYVLAIDKDLPALWLVEAHEELGDC